jgi:lipid-binding SYLF domain-containing protein
MKINARSFLILTTALLAVPAAVFAQAREEGRLLEATQVLEDLKSMPDQNVPDWLLARAQGIAVIPSVVKVGFIFGGRRGKGVLVVKDAHGSWSNPVFVTLTGGSVGWQAGVESTDVVLVFTTRAGIEGVTGGKVTLGADAAVAAGPVGRQTSAATDANFTAEVYSYSRTRGLFAGIALDGSAITIDRKANAIYYNKPGVLASDILSAAAPEPPASARRFLSTLGQTTTPAAAGGTAPSPGAPSGGVAQAAPQPSSTPQTSQLKTFPMEDPHPGQEPSK